MTATTRSTLSLRCDSETLADRLTLAFRAAPAKNPVAAMSGVLLRRDPQGAMELVATDGELTIRTSLPAEMSGDGEVVLHRIFSDVVRALPAGAVEVSVDDTGEASVESGRSKFRLRCYSRSDYPDIPEIPEPMVELETGELAHAIEQTVVAASTDRGRPILMGVLLTNEQGRTRLVATDSYRLAIRDLPLAGFLGEGESALLPARGLSEVAKLIGSGSGESQSVEVGVTDTRVAFRVGDTVVIASLIEGEFPSYEQLIPNAYQHRLELEKEAFLAALHRVGLLARDSTPVRLDLSSAGVVLRAIDPELGGEASEEVDAFYMGGEMTIAFNPTYLRDGLDKCDGDRIQIEVTEPLRPAMLSSPEAEAFRYLLMPVRV